MSKNLQIVKPSTDGVESATRPKPTPKLIFVGKNKFQIKRAKKFAESNGFRFLSYSEEDWATLEEIDQYIQEEEFSKKIVALPAGKRTASSLDELEAETIKKVVQDVNGNMMQAARTLKIARATLYRKIERYGMDLKKQREEQVKKETEGLKKAA